MHLTPRQEHSCESRLRLVLLFSKKAIRLLLAVSVSIWMAGGCLFGCANTTMAAEASHEGPNGVAVTASCHAKRPHDCCSVTIPKPKKHAASKQQLAVMPSFVPLPRGMMNECPLVVNSTAATSKNTTPVPDPARGAIAALPSFERHTEHTDITLVAPFPPDRGPTHIRYCVFLI
jgi:hypothetical protein